MPVRPEDLNPPIVERSPYPPVITPPPAQQPAAPTQPEIDIDSIVEKVLERLPEPKNGKDGENGKDGADGVAGKDGRDGRDAPSTEELIEKLKPLIANAVRNTVRDAVAGMPQGVTEERVHEILSGYPMGPSLLDVEQLVDTKMKTFANDIVSGILAIETPIRLGTGDEVRDIGNFRLGPDGFTIPSLSSGRSAVATMVVVATENARLVREVEAAKRSYERISLIPQSEVPPNVVVRRYPTLVAYASDGTVAGLWDGQRDVYQKLQAIARGLYP